ncbi:MAG: hypothetical protein E7361_01095 [Clostridiales bacterium]|nr:hypothetical protein [Clostridiales bacterium]
MKKTKVGMSILIAVLIVAVIGLSVGIVLVASSAKLGSSMRVQYTAGDQVDCSITASARIFANAEDQEGQVIMISDGTGQFTEEVKLVDIDAAMSETETKTIGNIDFQDVTLTAKGYSVYKFDFKNTAAVGASDIQVKLTAAIDDTLESHKGNVKVGVGTTLDEAKAATSLETTLAGLAVTDENATSIYIVMAIIEASIDADASVNVSIEITPDADIAG